MEKEFSIVFFYTNLQLQKLIAMTVCSVREQFQSKKQMKQQQIGNYSRRKDSMDLKDKMIMYELP